MAVSMKIIKTLLESDEPDYEKGTKIGIQAIPSLLKIVKSKDEILASKAVYLASMIGGDDALKVLEKGCVHKSSIVRISAADCCKKFKIGDIEKPLIQMMKDKDQDVLYIAIKSAKKFKRKKSIKDAINVIAKSNKKSFLKKEAKAILKTKMKLN